MSFTEKGQMTEVDKLLLLNYEDCINYLLKKYGPVPKDYFTGPTYKATNGNANSRTKDGLVIHHIDEDKAAMLSKPEVAKKNPFDFQRANRLIYCNLLELLILHIKIVEFPRKKQKPVVPHGVDGIRNFLVPELNDIYSGMTYNQEWKNAIAKKVLPLKMEYLKCIKKLVDIGFDYPLFKSFNETYGKWSSSNNSEIYSMMEKVGVKS